MTANNTYTLICCLFLSFLISNLNVCKAQSVATFSGKVIDGETNESVPYSTVQLMTLPDSTFLNGTTTDLNGLFKLRSSSLSSKKNYALKVSYIGYSPLIVPLKRPYTSSNCQLGNLKLNAGGIMLEETVITAKAPDAVMKGDTAQFNASAYRTPTGSMLEDLVKQLPGAEISPEGKLLIHGKEVKKIMIDGEEFFSDNPQAALKNLPAEFINSLRAYERQSDLARLTGVEDGEEQMVLDLSVKQDIKKGWTENVFAGIGNRGKYEAANSFNRFRDKSQFTLIGNINNTNNQGVQELNEDIAKASSNNKNRVGENTTKTLGLNWSTRTKRYKLRANAEYNNTKHWDEYNQSSQNLLSTMNAYSITKGANHNKLSDFRANASIEVKLDTFTTVIFRPNIRINSSNKNNESFQDGYRNAYANETDSDGDGIIQMNNRTSSYLNDNKYDNYSFMFQISRRFRKRGRSIALKFDYNNWNSNGDRASRSLTNYFYNEAISRRDTLTQRIDNKTKGDAYRAQFVYVEPLWKGLQLQFQYAYQHKVQNSNRFVYDWTWYNDDFENGYFDTSVLLDGSNYFETTFDNQLINVGLKKARKKFYYNFGVNVEPLSTKSQSHILKSDAESVDYPIIKNNTINYSPNVVFKYYFTKQINLKFNYVGKYRQPNLWDMQPVEDRTNPLSIRVGNENLESSYISTFNLNYNNYNSKRQRNIMLWLNLETVKNNIIQKTTYNEETGVKTTTPVNADGNWRLHGGFSVNTPFFSKYFTLRSYTYARGSEKYGYSFINNESILGAIEDRCAREKLSMVFRNSFMELDASGDVLYTYNYNKVRDFRYEFMDYNVSFNQLLYLPWNIELDNEMTYYWRTGYGDHDLGKERYIWNCQLSKAFLKKKQLILRFKMYDILKQDNAYFHSVSTSNINDSSYNVLGKYFMLHAILRLNVVGGKKNSK